MATVAISRPQTSEAGSRGDDQSQQRGFTETKGLLVPTRPNLAGDQFRAGSKPGADRCDPPRIRETVCIGSSNVSGTSLDRVAEACIRGRSRTLLRLVDEEPPKGRECGEYLANSGCTPIRAAVIHEEQCEVPVALGRESSEGRANPSGLVVKGNNDP
jgi:hypothetical protein